MSKTSAYDELMALTTIEEGERESQAEPTVHERAGWTLRMLLIELGTTTSWTYWFKGREDEMPGFPDYDFDSEYDTDREIAEKLWRLIWGLNREELTQVALSQSLCPIHFCDYAACFDDDEPECEAVRTVWPGHDT